MTDVSSNVRIVKVQKIELGASSSNKETLTNVIGYDPRPEHPDLQPSTNLTSVNPTGWRQPHKWVKITIQCNGNIYHPIHHNGSGNVNYYPSTTDTPVLPYLKFFGLDENGMVWTETATGAIVNRVYTAMADDKTTLTVIEIKAYSLTPLTPAIP